MGDSAPPPPVNVWAARAAAAKEARREEVTVDKQVQPKQKRQEQHQRPQAVLQQVEGKKTPALEASAQTTHAVAIDLKPFAWKKVDQVKPVPVPLATVQSGGGGQVGSETAMQTSNGTLEEQQEAGDYISERLRVQPECAGFIVGPKGRVVNEISRQTYAHIISPRKEDEPIFVISGHSACVKAAAALVRVREQEALEKESKGAGNMGATQTITQSVPESLVGYVMGRERAVIHDIGRQTRTVITCPMKGGPPDFAITGVPLCIDAAKLCILAKIHQVSGIMLTWQSEKWYAPETIEIQVPHDRVGLVVGSMGSVISTIANQTGTVIASPKKGHDPIFIVTGTKHAVMLAKSAIEDKVNGTMHGHHGPHQHKEKKRHNKLAKPFTSLPSVVSWFPPKTAHGNKLS